MWGRHRSDFYLVDQIRARMEISEVMRSVRDLRNKYLHQVGQILVEDASNGTAIIQLLKRELPGVVAVKPLGGKMARAQATEYLWRAKNVLLPENARWVGDFIEELVGFPDGALHDDQTDCMSQALTSLAHATRGRAMFAEAMKNAGNTMSYSNLRALKDGRR